MASLLNLKKILKAEWQIIHDSPTRKEDFMSVTSASVFHLPFCVTRWVENKNVADRAILVLPHIVEIVRFWQKLVTCKQPKCSSYTKLKEAASDMLMIPKLEFFYICCKCSRAFFMTSSLLLLEVHIFLI